MLMFQGRPFDHVETMFPIVNKTIYCSRRNKAIGKFNFIDIEIVLSDYQKKYVHLK